MNVFRAISFCCFLLTGIGCSPPHLKPCEYPIDSAHRAVVSLSAGGAWGRQYRYIADGRRACREVSFPEENKNHSTSYPLRRQQEVVPTETAWLRFWAEVDRLRVSEWGPRYFAEDIGLQVYDGTQWWMTYQTHSTKRETSGDNAYPKLGAPRTVTLDNKAFDDLFDAFASLFPTPMKSFEK